MSRCRTESGHEAVGPALEARWALEGQARLSDGVFQSLPPRNGLSDLCRELFRECLRAVGFGSFAGEN